MIGGQADGFSILPGSKRAPVVFTCEHASAAVPDEYSALGLAEAHRLEHIGWDIGAAPLTQHLAAAFDAPAVMAGYSRLLVDCNRAPEDADLIVERSDGIYVPGNRGVDSVERQRRMKDFYEPFHSAVDDVVADTEGALILSVHSFTPYFDGAVRDFDAGVLFDDFAGDARRLGQAMLSNGLSTRYNEPYSGMDGLIFSARHHGRRHDRLYLEIEVNNRILRDSSDIASVAGLLERALRRFLEGL